MLFLLHGGLLVSLAGCGGAIQSLVPPAATSPVSSPAAVKSGPQLGYVWSERARTLRPVLGIAGSAQLGQTLVDGDVYTAGAASNLSGLALLEESDGTLDLMALPGGQPARLNATAAPGASLRFAPSGLAAVAFVPGTNTVTLLTGLPTSPKSATITLGQPISDAAVSDAGSIAAASVAAGSTTVRTVTAAGVTHVAATIGALGGLAFAGSGEDLVVADATANTVTLVHASTSAPSPLLLPDAGLLKTPVALGTSRDGRWAVVANGAEPSVVRIDVTARTAPQRFLCDCQPALVAPLSGTGVFRLTSADSGPAWIFDAAASTPRVLFIPASASALPTKAGGN